MTKHETKGRHDVLNAESWHFLSTERFPPLLMHLTPYVGVAFLAYVYTTVCEELQRARTTSERGKKRVKTMNELVPGEAKKCRGEGKNSQ
jgi:hypothetical protein